MDTAGSRPPATSTGPRAGAAPNAVVAGGFAVEWQLADDPAPPRDGTRIVGGGREKRR
jgi:hypothetical protein